MATVLNPSSSSRESHPSYDGSASNADYTAPIRAIIADDEVLAREKARRFMQRETNIQVVAEAASVPETIAAVERWRPDVLLLDVEMPGGSGFDVLSSVSTELLPLVIFTTAYDRYAVNAFEAQAVDYLLKPFDQARFHQAIERARKELARGQADAITARLIEMMRRSRTMKDRLLIRAGGQIVFLDPDDINWIEAAANYVRLHNRGETLVVRETIGRILTRLDPKQFVRIHRSLVVNLDRIKAVSPCNSGEYIITLVDGKELSCSRGYRASIRDLLER